MKHYFAYLLIMALNTPQLFTPFSTTICRFWFTEICVYLQVNRKLNFELVYLVPLVSQVYMLYRTIVFAQDLEQDYTALSHARCCILNVMWPSDPSCVVCWIRDKLLSIAGFQGSQLPWWWNGGRYGLAYMAWAFGQPLSTLRQVLHSSVNYIALDIDDIVFDVLHIVLLGSWHVAVHPHLPIPSNN